VSLPTVLVVDADTEVLTTTVDLLRASHYEVIGVSSFEVATSVLATWSPDLLITDVRLGMFNGIHLVIRRHLRDRRAESIVIDTCYDAVLEADVRRAGAVYLVKPVDRGTLLKAVKDLVLGLLYNRRQWPRTLPHGVAMISVDQHQARLVDVGYGGCQVVLAERPAHSAMLRIDAASIMVRGRVAWTATEPDVVRCGLALTESDQNARSAWRQWVDRINAS
jgi:DNA-binding response OmpR family regulator